MNLLTHSLSTLTLGPPQQFKNTIILPIFAATDHGPEYLTLHEALSARLVTVAEVSQGGHVPQLKVSNSAATPVLLVDGEELLGAKQNRVLNTSILLKPASETIIPVSCTEAGRWGYSSLHLSHSGHVMSSKLRKLKSSTVLASLKHAQGYSSDQAALWMGVRELEMKAGSKSSTHALADTFQAKFADLDQFVAAFPLLPNQNGLIALINGEVAGFDLLSHPRAYKALHAQFVKSYALDALLETRQAASPQPQPPQEHVRALLEQFQAANERIFPAIGLGADHRFEAPYVAGMALVTDDRIIHLNLYRN